MARKTIKTTFAGGELAPQLEGRVDISRYATSVQLAKNFLATRFGGMSNRPGLKYAGKSASTGTARLIPFEFSVTQTYFLEFTNNLIRFIKSGSPVLTSRRSATYKWTASGSGTSEYYCELAAGGDPSIPGAIEVWENSVLIPSGTIGALTAGTWAYGDNDTLGYNTIYIRLTDSADPDSKAADYVQSDYQLATTLGTAVLDAMTYTQSFDTLFLAGAFFPKKVVRSADDSWAISDLVFTPSGTPPVDIDAVATGFSGTDRQVLYKVSTLSSTSKESLPSETQTVNIALNWPATGARVDLYWRNIRSASFQWTASGSGTAEYYLEALGGGDPSITEPSAVYGNKLAFTKGTLGSLAVSNWAYGDNDSLGYSTIYVRLADGTDPDTKGVGFVTYKLSTDVQWRVYKNYRGDWGWLGDVETPWFLDDNVEPSVGRAPKEDATPFDSSDSDTWPYAVGIFEQRLHYGRTNKKPQTIFSSQTGDLTNFSISRPLSSEDTIEAELASGGRSDEIRHILSLDRMMILTIGSEWTFDRGSNTDALTPFSYQFRNQGFGGCSSTVQPLGVNNECLFIQRDNRDIRSLRFNSKEDGYLGEVLSYYVPHLLEDRTIIDWCYQQHPNNIVWIVLSDGDLLSMTYIPEQQMIAFCRHETDGYVEACASITSSGNDQVAFIVKRIIGGSAIRYIETLAERSFTDLRDAKFLDSMITYDERQDIEGVVVAAGAVTVTITGHGLSNGDYVLIDGVTGITSTGNDSEYSTFNDKYYKVANVAANTFTLQSTNDGSDLTSDDFEGTYIDGGTAGKTTSSVTGLGHLEGETVGILADGQVLPQGTVAGGSVSLGSNSIGYAVVHAGLPYECDLQTLRLEPADGSTIQGKTSVINEVRIRFHKSVGGKMGPDVDHLLPLKERQFEEWRSPISPKTSDIRFKPQTKHTDTGRMYFRQSDPLPTEILMYIMYYEVGGA